MTIFVVDDEPLAVESLKLNISKSLDEEARIVGFSNSSDVLAYLEEDKPDIVFLDIEMPGMNGVNLASTLKNRLPGVIIIFVTAYNDYALCSSLRVWMTSLRSCRMCSARGRSLPDRNPYWMYSVSASSRLLQTESLSDIKGAGPRKFLRIWSQPEVPG